MLSKFKYALSLKLKTVWYKKKSLLLDYLYHVMWVMYT